MSLYQRYTVSRCLTQCFRKCQSSSLRQTRNITFRHWRHNYDKNSYRNLCTRHSQRHFLSEFRRVISCFNHLNSPCLCSRSSEKLSSAESNLNTFLTLKQYMSTSSSNFSLKNQVMRDYVDSLIADYEELEKQADETRDKRTRARLMELSSLVDITRMLKLRYNELEELNKLQAGINF